MNNKNSQQIGNYRIKQELGKGTFGTILKAVKKQNINNNDQQQFAIKIEGLNTLKPLLHLEYQFFNQLINYLDKNTSNLAQKSNKIGYQVPKVYQYKQNDYFSYMVMQLLSTTLQDFCNKIMKNSISKDSLIRIFYNILIIIENMHELGYIHRDIKPANFMLKRKLSKNNHQKSNKLEFQPIIYPIDLGLAKRYINPITNKHINLKQNKKLVGTAIFCSLNNHKGLQQSRRDDLESLIYLITYLVKKLPWQAVANKALNKAQYIKNKLNTYDEIYKVKKQTNFEQLLKDSKILPDCLCPIYQYILKLSFQQEPNYKFIYDLLEKQHKKLTNKSISKNNCQCIWQNLINQKLKQIKEQKNQIDNSKKKIKINFKIPSNKLKITGQINKVEENQEENIKNQKNQKNQKINF